MILVLFGGLAFLFPLAVYCLFLAVLNYRRHATMISGPWDCAAMLCAVSGFLFVGGPCVLTGWHEEWRLMWLEGDYLGFLAHGAKWWSFWVGLFALYFLAVLAGGILMMWLRRRATAIYNLDPEDFDTVLGEVLQRLDLKWRRVANRVFVDCRSQPSTRSEREAVHAEERATALPQLMGDGQPARTPPPIPDPAATGAGFPDGQRILVLEIDPFRAFRHITLHWRYGAHDPLRRDMEAEIAKELHALESGPNSTGLWFATIAVSIFSTIFFTVVLLIALFMVMNEKNGKISPRGAIEGKPTRSLL